MQSLRRFNIALFSIIALLLAALVATGFRKQNMAFDYDAIVQESESTIFLYTTVQDQAMEGLLSRDRSQLFAAAKEFEQLQSRYTALLDNALISTQYKLSFMGDLDLGRVIVNLRTLAEKSGSDELAKQIMAQLRHINKQFLQFDRIVVNEMRSRVMNYQKTALIIMGAIISLACFGLAVLYLKSVKPLTSLSAQAEQALRDGRPLDMATSGTACLEVRSLLGAMNHLLQRAPDEDGHDPLASSRREAEFSTVINEATNRINGIINYAQLLMDSKAMATNEVDQQEILAKIIKHGEQCAVTLRKGIK
ncbi:hypothetical protein [Desulfobulbus sp.]|uniref:hypothetical protein n=1 Tax=Desulfobulbus sp. TaxID=895 RepID=UPI00286F09ED|nr:hypothetical protein [Desulfobulbus sp.]